MTTWFRSSNHSAGGRRQADGLEVGVAVVGGGEVRRAAPEEGGEEEAPQEEVGVVADVEARDLVTLLALPLVLDAQLDPSVELVDGVEVDLLGHRLPLVVLWEGE